MRGTMSRAGYRAWGSWFYMDALSANTAARARAGKKCEDPCRKQRALNILYAPPARVFYAIQFIKTTFVSYLCNTNWSRLEWYQNTNNYLEIQNTIKLARPV